MGIFIHGNFCNSKYVNKSRLNLTVKKSSRNLLKRSSTNKRSLLKSQRKSVLALSFNHQIYLSLFYIDIFFNYSLIYKAVIIVISWGNFLISFSELSFLFFQLYYKLMSGFIEYNLIIGYKSNSRFGFLDHCLEFTPMHKMLRVQLPDLRYTDCRVDFSAKSFT